MGRWLKWLLAGGAAIATGASVVLAVWWAIGAEADPRIGAVAQILFDELDFYDHPTYMGNFYPSFMPERVRRNNVSYYFRAGTGAKSGERYGEIVLRADQGSLIYLPPDVALEGLSAISLQFRKSNADARVFIGIYEAADRSAIIHEGDSQWFRRGKVAEWSEAVVSTARLRYTDNWCNRNQTFQGFLNPVANLRFLAPQPGKLYALEIGLKNCAAGDTLCIDAIKLFQKASPSHGRVTGCTHPAKPGVEITLNTPTQQLHAKTNDAGSFTFDLPAGTTRYELSALDDGVRYLPTAGRYHEVGEYLPEIRFHLNNGFPTITDGTTAIQYVGSERGAHYPPHAFMLQSDKLEYFTEFSINGFGYNDRDRRRENPDGAYRVVYVGDCIVADQQTGNQEMFNNQAESIFRFYSKKPVEVINAAHGSLTMSSAYPAIVNYALKLKPNLIMLNIGHPVLFSMDVMENYARHNGFSPSHPYTYSFDIDTRTGTLIHIPNDPNWQMHAADAPKFKPGETIHKNNGVDWHKDILRTDPAGYPPPLRKAIRIYCEALKLFVAEARKQNCEVCLVFTTEAPGRAGPRKVWTEDGVDYDTERYFLTIKEIADEAGIEVHDAIRPILDRAKGPDPLSPGRADFGDISGQYSRVFWRRAYHWPSLFHRYLGEEVAGQMCRRLGEEASPILAGLGRLRRQ